MRHIVTKIDLLCRILLTLLYVASCSPKATSSGRSALKSAIVLYISGQYTEARDRLLHIIKQPQADEDRRTAYLYLGRCFEVLGNYDAAVDMYTSGMQLGDARPFYEHIQALRSRFDADPQRLRMQEALTRAQVACLIDRFFGEAQSGQPAARETSCLESIGALPTDIQQHWAREPICRVLRLGAMSVLPDSLFHADEKVTQAAFFFIVSRLRNAIQGDPPTRQSLFPEGFRGIVRRQAQAFLKNGSPVFISGEDAITILEKLSQLRGGSRG